MFGKVKLIKYFLITILLIIVSIIPGELFQGYLDQYNDFYETSFYLPNDVSGDEMLNELSKTANKYNIYIFKIYEKEKNAYSSSMEIYANYDMLKILSDDYGISQGIFKSLFSGKTIITSYSFSEISEELLQSDTKYYLYGNEDNMIHFKEELVDTYAGSFPKEEGFNDFESYKALLIVAWLFATIIVILLTAYDAIIQKKENFVRLTMGEYIWIQYMKNIVLDTIYMIFLYNALKVIINDLQGNLIFELYSDKMFLLMIVLNAIVFIKVSKINYKTATADTIVDGRILHYNYFVSASSMVILIISIVSCIELVNTSYEYSNQEDYFKEHKDYNWYQNMLIEGSTDERLQEYLNDFISDNPSKFLYLCQGEKISDKSNMFFYEASAGSRKYLQSKIVELDKQLESEIYILISKNNMISEYELHSLFDWIDTNNYEVVYYSDSIDIVYRVFDEEPITEMIKNPVILFYNNDNANRTIDESIYEFHLGMIDDSSGKWERIAKENGINYVETNVWDYYCYRWNALERTIILNIVIIIIMTLMYLLVSCVIIKLEFKLNAKELAIKKIYGYHIFERFGKMYGVTGIISLLSILVILFLDLFLVDIKLWDVLGTIIIIMCIQYIFITWQIMLYEKNNMLNILKGGNR